MQYEVPVRSSQRTQDISKISRKPVLTGLVPTKHVATPLALKFQTSAMRSQKARAESLRSSGCSLLSSACHFHVVVEDSRHINLPTARPCMYTQKKGKRERRKCQQAYELDNRVDNTSAANFIHFFSRRTSTQVI